MKPFTKIFLKDKRIKNYFLVNEFAIMMNDWLKKEHSFFTKSNGIEKN